MVEVREMSDESRLSGSRLSGGKSIRGRLDDDFYATNPKAVERLLDAEEFLCERVLEPSVGTGNIANVIRGRFPNAEIVGIDICDRGWVGTRVEDFLFGGSEYGKFDTIIQNPPYASAEDFIWRSLALLSEGGKMACFLKLVFLESQGRERLFSTYPPKYIYVFRERMGTWRNGEELDERGNPWGTTICFAWFVWYEGYRGEPIVRWL